ncbi:MAG TPA: DNA polymerase III subunit alpha [Rhodospirillales bacterium]|nr:DNA polymerase III subunit alpha [Rhodospirillales bacterium]
MPHADFVHLRVHSAYSLSEGAIPIKELVRLSVDKNMPAVAITDTNNLFGALEFAAAAKAGVQPIIGCQLSITREKKADASHGSKNGTNASHKTAQDSDALVLLVQNEVGYHNLLQLISRAYLGDPETGPPIEPQVALSALASHSEGLIALTGGPLGPVGNLLVNGQIDEAKALIGRLKEIFPDRLYVELMRHGLAEEEQTESGFLDMAYDMDLPIVATNECFFSDTSMHEAHDALICIAEGAYISDTERRRLSPDNGFKSAMEMRSLFRDLPEAVDNTLVIAQRTAFMAEPRPPILPPYDCGTNRSEGEELTAQAKAGLEARIEAQVFTPDLTDDEKQHAAAPYRKRLEYELKVIDDMGYQGYFLIVADFIHWAKDHGIPVGPGRGSGAGSVVAWALTITDLDPLRFGLLFERFLNPDRISMPDFDIDFCQDRRDEVIRYVQEKYGRDHVAQIITFGKLQARAVLRDVGRVLEMPYGYVDKICKLVPSNPANPPTLDEAMKAEPQIRQLANEDPQVDKLIRIARQLEGLYRHASTHAAGVVIGDRPLQELIPLYRDPKSDMPVSGFSMKYVEAAGLVKFDFLGLKTLTVLSRAEKLVRETGAELDISKIPLDDKTTFELIAEGDTTGVFQLESSGMVQVLKNLRPDTFEDIIAVVALYRPGPMDNIPSYIKRKHGNEAPDYLYPTLEGILKETFGIIIYQEQVMQIAQELSGYSLGGADILRRAMGKKIRSEMAEQRQVFIKGAIAKGVPEAKANEIFDLVNKFADYGFNKSHAAAYALVAYQTAYMKANHPVEFMAASMTLDMGNTDKLSVFHQELQHMGIKVRGPDVNASDANFTVERDTDSGGGAIRYALAAIKNVGEAAMEGLVRERRENGPFKDLFDFAQRLDPHAVNKRQMENLVRAGAFDGLCSNRRQVHGAIEMLLRHASIAINERDSGQMGLFGGEGAGAAPVPSLPEIDDWLKMDRLSEEFEATGLYLSGHPLDDFAPIMKRLKVKTSADIVTAGKSGPRRMAGTLLGISERTSKKGNRYAFLSFTDTSGVFEAIAFSETINQNRDILEAGQSFFIRAQFDTDGRFSVQSLQLLEKAGDKVIPGLAVVVSSATPLTALRDVLSGWRHGRGHVTVTSRLEEGAEVDIELSGGYALTPDVINAVRAIPGIVEARES